MLRGFDLLLPNPTVRVGLLLCTPEYGVRYERELQEKESSSVEKVSGRISFFKFVILRKKGGAGVLGRILFGTHTCHRAVVKNNSRNNDSSTQSPNYTSNKKYATSFEQQQQQQQQQKDKQASNQTNKHIHHDKN